MAKLYFWAVMSMREFTPPPRPATIRKGFRSSVLRYC